jgi:tetratricopeptide (TPR) repeat protein
MLFDIRGRRKRVIQIVYAALALLMALSLFTVVGPVSFGDLFGNGTSGDSSAFEDQAQQIERQLAKDPKNEQLLIRDVRARYTAANSQIQTDPSGTQTGITEQGLEDFRKAGDAWIRYVKLNPKRPNPNAAQLAATALLYSSTLADLDTRVKAAADAQAIVADARPSPNAYLTLAQYRFLAGDVKAAEEAGQKAKQEAPAAQRSLVEQTIVQYGKQSQQLRKQAEQAAKSQAGGGKQALENPVGGLAGGGSVGGTAP